MTAVGHYGEPVSMVAEEHTGAAEARPTARGPAERRWDQLRLLLLVGWLAVAVLTVVLGDRAGSWEQLRAGVASGSVDHVEVNGELPERTAGAVSGVSVVELRWRDGLVGYRADVVQVLGADPDAAAMAETERTASALGPGTPALTSYPSVRLQQLRADVDLTSGDGRPAVSGDLLGWRVPGALPWAVFGLVLVAFAVLALGPVPWRATRWAWFWLMWTPIASVGFLLLGGPTPGIPASAGRRRLTGGWAFLLSLLLAPLFALNG